MIQINKREFPNPVLAPGRDDYEDDCMYSFSVNADEIKITTDFIEILVSYELKCDSLEKLVSEGKLCSIIKVKSSAASFCHIYEFEADKRNKLIQIPKFSVVSNMELTGLIVARNNIDHFSCIEMNALYFTGMTFEFRKGDTFAMDTPRVIYIDDSELEKPIASIFTINNVQQQEEDIVADFTDEKININLSEELDKMYWTLKDFNNGALRRYVTAVIVYPALVEAIDIIKMNYKDAVDDDYSEKRWFRAIELKAQKLNVDMRNFSDSSTMLADKLLGNISLDALKSFKDMLDQEMNSGETQMIGGVD